MRQIPESSIQRLVPEGDQPGMAGLKIPVEDLTISVRAFNCLRASGIANLHELALASPGKLLRVGNLGLKTLRELASVVAEYFNLLERDELRIYAETRPLWEPYFPFDSGSAPSSHHIRTERLKSESGSPTVLFSPEPAVTGSQRQASGLQVAIGDLPLSVRASGCLERTEIHNLHELALSLPNRLRRVKNLGPNTLKELASIVERYFNSLEPALRVQYEKSHSQWQSCITGQLDAEPPEPSSIVDIISAYVQKQSTRNREVIIRRFGLRPGTRPQTLDAVGRSVGLTRERIRQIAVKLKKLLAAQVYRARPGLVPHLGEHLRAVSVATISEIAALIPNLGEPIEFHFDACVRLLLASFPGIHAVDPGSQLWSADPSIDKHFYQEVIRTARAILRGTRADSEILAVETARRLRRRGDEVQTIRAIIQNATSVFAVQPSDQSLTLLEGQSVQNQRRAFTYDYIREQGVPIRISEILDAMQEMEPNLMPDSPTRLSAVNNLRALFERDDRFAWAGLSTLGLREWGYDPGVTSIGQAALALLRRAGPLTTSDIQETLGQLYRVSPNSIPAALNTEKGKTVNRDPDGRWYAFR